MARTSARVAWLVGLAGVAGPAGLAGLWIGCAETSPSGVVVAPVAPPPSGAAAKVDTNPAPAEVEADPGRVVDAGPEGAPARFRACTVDSDCVAVPRVGCCHNGQNEAVAATQKDAYAASFVCPEAHPICAMFIVRDTRRPTCNATSHLCELVPR
jgi:hypothetical protein